MINARGLYHRIYNNATVVTWIFFIAVALCLPEVRLWKFKSTFHSVVGEISSFNRAVAREKQVVWHYDASDTTNGEVGEMLFGTALLAAPEPTGLTKIGGGALFLHGADMIAAGLKQFWINQSVQTFTSQIVSGGLITAGVPSPYANMVGNLSEIGLAAVPIGIVGEVGVKALHGTSAIKAGWGFWGDYPKITVDGRQYAKIGDRLFTQHAIDRMTPSGLGIAAGGAKGRSVSPNFVTTVLTSPATRQTPVTGPIGQARISHRLGSLEIITEQNIIITH